MPPCERRSRAPLAASGTALVLSLTACTGASTVDDGVEGASAAGSGSLSAGYVGSIDQLGLPIAAETGTFEDHGLDVTLAAPFPTGVDAINALEAGDVDVIQVGVPGLAALDSGVDLVIVGHYSGSAAQRNVDDTMSLVAVEDADIDPEDLTTLEGRTIATSLGTINHLYLLALLEEEGVDPEDVDLVNTAPPDMPVALETGGADAAVAWDPWPLTVTDQVEGAWEVVRGGGYLPYVGYVMTTPEYLAGNGETVRAFLTARAESDQWIRHHPEDAADSATRWLTGTDPDIARAAMEHNLAQLDGRFSACNYLALDTVSRLLSEQGVTGAGIDVDSVVDPSFVLAVQEDHPELFDDLPEVPDSARITPDHTFDRAADEEACAV